MPRKKITESVVSEAEAIVADMSSDGNGVFRRKNPLRKFRISVAIEKYAGNAMTKDTAFFIRFETVRRSKLKFGEDYAINKTLEQFGITKPEYERLKKTVHFYFDVDAEIFIPDRQIKGCLKETVEKTRQKKVQDELKDKISRMIITPDSISTGRNLGDAEWCGRPVKYPSKDGEVGRWDYTETPFLKNVKLNFTLATADFKTEELIELLQDAQEKCFIGGMRSEGFGRFDFKKFEEVVSAVAKRLQAAEAAVA